MKTLSFWLLLGSQIFASFAAVAVTDPASMPPAPAVVPMAPSPERCSWWWPRMRRLAQIRKGLAQGDVLHPSDAAKTYSNTKIGVPLSLPDAWQKGGSILVIDDLKHAKQLAQGAEWVEPEPGLLSNAEFDRLDRAMQAMAVYGRRVLNNDEKQFLVWWEKKKVDYRAEAFFLSQVSESTTYEDLYHKIYGDFVYAGYLSGTAYDKDGHHPTLAHRIRRSGLGYSAIKYGSAAAIAGGFMIFYGAVEPIVKSPVTNRVKNSEVGKMLGIQDAPTGGITNPIVEAQLIENLAKQPLIERLRSMQQAFAWLSEKDLPTAKQLWPEIVKTFRSDYAEFVKLAEAKEKQSIPALTVDTAWLNAYSDELGKLHSALMWAAENASRYEVELGRSNVGALRKRSEAAAKHEGPALSSDEQSRLNAAIKTQEKYELWTGEKTRLTQGLTRGLAYTMVADLFGQQPATHPKEFWSMVTSVGEGNFLETLRDETARVAEGLTDLVEKNEVPTYMSGLAGLAQDALDMANKGAVAVPGRAVP